jgi:excisionase family DNA binding protein
LLSGEAIELADLTPHELSFLRSLKKLVKDGVSYFDIERAAIGPGSPALNGRNRVDHRIVSSPLYRVARDIATEAGIHQNLILAPEHEKLRRELPTDRSMISVTQAANFLGISRAAVHKAIQQRRLKARKIGNLVIVDREDCEAYAAARQTPRSERKAQRSSARARAGSALGKPPLAAKAR